MILRQDAAKIYDTIFFFIEYFNPKEIENEYINVFDNTDFMISCYNQVKAEIGTIPNYLFPLFLYHNGVASPMSQFRSDYFDFENDNIDSFILKIITNSDKFKAKTYDRIFGDSKSENYIDALQSLDVPLEFKLQVSMLFGDFDHAIKTLIPLLKQVYLSIEKLNIKYEHEIASRFEQIQSNTNIKTYQNFLKYDSSRLNSTEVSVCLLNQYLVYDVDNAEKILLMFGYKHEEAIGEQFDDSISINVEQFLLCCGNDIRLSILKILCERDELTSSQISQILECPVTTIIRHINQLRDNSLVLISKRDGLQIFYKLNIMLLKKLQIQINNFFDNIFIKKGKLNHEKQPDQRE